MKKQRLALIGICIILLMTSCGQSQSESSPSKKAEAPSVKNEAEITKDLSENEDFYTLFDANCYDEHGNYSGSAYSIDELTITRRNQWSGKQDALSYRGPHYRRKCAVESLGRLRKWMVMPPVPEIRVNGKIYYNYEAPG